MLKRILILLTSISLTACGMFYESVNPQSQTETCKQLKRQLIYNNSNRNNEASWITPAQKQELMLKLKENHCDD